MQQAAKRAYDMMLKIPRDKEKNPLSLDGAIRSMILKCPDYVQWRDDALNIMYCVLGTGISWNEDGRLADRQPNNYMNPPPAAGGQGVWSNDFGLDDTFGDMKLPQDIQDSIKRKNEQEVRNAIQVVNEIETRCREYRPARQRWYPISWYSCHLCAPINAQEDFFLGAVETASLIAGFEPKFEDNYWFESVRTQNYAKEILSLLQHQRLLRLKLTNDEKDRAILKQSRKKRGLTI